MICDCERCVYSNLKIFPLLFERETPVDVLLFSLQFDESPKREKESLFVGEKTHFTTLSLSPRVFFFRSLLFVFPRRFFLSLFFKSYVGRKKNEDKGERFCLVLKPYTLNNFFFKCNEELISCKIESRVNVDIIIHTRANNTEYIYRIYIYLNRERERERERREREKSEK